MSGLIEMDDNKGIAVVVCSGEIKDYSKYGGYFDDADFVICADGGAVHLRKFGIVPDILLGDFDSISSEDLDFYSTAISTKNNTRTEIIKHPVEKDKTDSEIAVLLAAEKGYNPIYLIGATGNRLDHTLANIFLTVKMLEQGVVCSIVDEHNELVTIDNSITLKRDGYSKVSIIPITGKITGVTTEGLYYKLYGAAIEFGSTLGISNELVSEKPRISIDSGMAIIIKSRD